MKKKVLLTIVLILGIVLFVNLVIHFSYQAKYAIDELMIVPETMAYGIKKRLAQWIIYAVFSVFNIVLYLILIIKTWKINYNAKNNYEQWKIDKEEKRKQKVEQKKKKLEEKLNKLQ